MIAGKEGVDIYNDAVNTIRRAYYKLGKMGVPQEDIRLQPQMNTHRVYWMISLRSLLVTLSNRCGYIAQASLWTPITAGVISELRRLNMEFSEEFLKQSSEKILNDSGCSNVAATLAAAGNDIRNTGLHDDFLGFHNVYKAYRNTDNQLRLNLALDCRHVMVALFYGHSIWHTLNLLRHLFPNLIPPFDTKLIFSPENTKEKAQKLA